MTGRFSTYSLVQVDGVLARHNVGDGRATALLPFGVAGHFCFKGQIVSNLPGTRRCRNAENKTAERQDPA